MRDHPLEIPADALVCHYWQGERLRSRSVSHLVLSGVVDIPEAPARLRADWEREISQHMTLDPGDVDQLPLARARTRWPDFAQCVRAASGWTAGLGLDGLLAESDIALMVCRGARYHHDGDYGGMAFCNLFVGEDKGQDVHFPWLGLRIPLQRGTMLVFDTCQPHAVIPRGGEGFNPADFPADRDDTQPFLTWELPIEDPRVARALRIDFDIDAATSATLAEGQLRRGDQRVAVRPDSGELFLS